MWLLKYSGFKSAFYMRATLGFRFCGFGQFLIQFFGFRTFVLVFGGLCGLWVFSNLVFGVWFLQLSTMMAVLFFFFWSTHFTFFLVLQRTLHHAAPGAKTIFPRDHLQLEECMTSLVSLAAVISVATAAKQTIKS